MSLYDLGKSICANSIGVILFSYVKFDWLKDKMLLSRSYCNRGFNNDRFFSRVIDEQHPRNE